MPRVMKGQLALFDPPVERPAYGAPMEQVHTSRSPWTTGDRIMFACDWCGAMPGQVCRVRPDRSYPPPYETDQAGAETATAKPIEWTV